MNIEDNADAGIPASSAIAPSPLGMKALKYALLLTSVALPACNETTAPHGETGQVLLEIEYVNYAWVPTYFGFFVDASGDVYSYDREGTPWAHDEDRVIREDDLEDKFSLKRTLITKRDSSEMRLLKTRIAAVNDGQVSAEKVQCADAGRLIYRAYRYNAGNSTYEPVLLRMEGDAARENTSQAARDIVAYIRSLDLLEELLGCDP